ncbi:hypothetical protein PAXINDRAFT_14566, partial [Paxillus involutus ATCC 200175]
KEDEEDGDCIPSDDDWEGGLVEDDSGDREGLEKEDTPAISIEDLIPESGQVDVAEHDWVTFESKRIHKASVIRCLFTSDKARKSRERLLHVRGYTRDFSPHSNLNCEGITGEQFIVGDLAAVLIRCGKTFSVGILQVTAIEQNKQRVSAVSEESLHLSTCDTFISGQVLEMTNAALQDEAGQPFPPEIQQLYLWTGSYCRFTPLKAKKSPQNRVSRKTLLIRVPGHMVHPLNLRIEPTSYLLPS